MYQTARMLDIALSRKLPPVCITLVRDPAREVVLKEREALTHPRASGLCQRIKLVAPRHEHVLTDHDVGQDRDRPPR